MERTFFDEKDAYTWKGRFAMKRTHILERTICRGRDVLSVLGGNSGKMNVLAEIAKR